ncbi:MAG TPA: cbb3-type cytochrome oxidase assembly protein CcoS [Gaiellaceae bacterium]|jgi:protein-S-isoprenylcysteine O-methyltransferase Ste14|nr:cbb3-type cytochrome oxidase assembly protein CcoS [Gaiellaceae bacterium]
MRRWLSTLALVLALALAAPAAAFAHDAPENDQSRWTMADWMIDTFFVFAGIALIGFIWAWKAGHFHNLEEAARVPLQIEEEDYYTPDWALDEEEWADADR